MFFLLQICGAIFLLLQWVVEGCALATCSWIELWNAYTGRVLQRFYQRCSGAVAVLDGVDEYQRGRYYLTYTLVADRSVGYLEGGVWAVGAWVGALHR